MSELNFSWETIKDFITLFGWVKGIFAIFFFLAHFWVWRLYSGRLADRQKEIERLADDNRQYRERFLALIDKQFEYQKPELPPQRSRKSLKKG